MTRQKVLRERNTNITAVPNSLQHRRHAMEIYERCQNAPAAHTNGIVELKKVFDKVSAFEYTSALCVVVQYVT